MSLLQRTISYGDSVFSRELLLLEGISLQGLGNWQAIAEHVGTRTKEEIEEHYNSVYVDSPNWPLPVSRSHAALPSLTHSLINVAAHGSQVQH